MVLKYEPWGDNPIFDWDEGNLEEIWRHKVHDFEIEECFSNEHITVPHRGARSEPKKYGDRYEVRGVTNGGRQLVIIVQHLGHAWVRPITAWDQQD